MPTQKPSKTAYQKLLKDIAGIHDRAMQELGAAVDSIFKEARWEIGRLIVEVEQKGEAHAPYGKHLLENLSNDLTKMNRKGFSVTNLRNMRLVYSGFPIHQISDELTWSHYVTLSSIKDKKQRQVYAKKAIQKKWDIGEFEKVLKADKVALHVIDASETKALPAPQKDVKVIRLAVKRGVLRTYKIVEPLSHSPQKDSFWIDCGFYIYRELQISEFKKSDAPLPKPEDIVTMFSGREGYVLKRLETKEPLPKSILYTYGAQVVKVIDADTLTVMVDLGFGTFSKQKLRLRKINAPELSTPAGKKARAYVLKRLKPGSGVVVKTYSTDIYNRYLVDVFYIKDCHDVERIAREGILLNQELIDEGLAELWQTPDPDDLAFLN